MTALDALGQPCTEAQSVLQVEWMFSKPACLELTHNWGSEVDASYKAHSGNEEPKGYGEATSKAWHVCFTIHTNAGGDKRRTCCAPCMHAPCYSAPQG